LAIVLAVRFRVFFLIDGGTNTGTNSDRNVAKIP
jgi:hypothetical protein